MARKPLRTTDFERPLLTPELATPGAAHRRSTHKEIIRRASGRLESRGSRADAGLSSRAPTPGSAAQGRSFRTIPLTCADTSARGVTLRTSSARIAAAADSSGLGRSPSRWPSDTAMCARLAPSVPAPKVSANASAAWVPCTTARRPPPGCVRRSVPCRDRPQCRPNRWGRLLLHSPAWVTRFSLRLQVRRSGCHRLVCGQASTRSPCAASARPRAAMSAAAAYRRASIAIHVSSAATVPTSFGSARRVASAHVSGDVGEPSGHSVVAEEGTEMRETAGSLPRDERHPRNRLGMHPALKHSLRVVPNLEHRG